MHPRIPINAFHGYPLFGKCHIQTCYEQIFYVDSVAKQAGLGTTVRPGRKPRQVIFSCVEALIEINTSLFSGTRGSLFGQGLDLLAYFLFAIYEGVDESV